MMREKFIRDTCAIVSSDHMAAVICAASLRRAQIVTETFLSGSVRKQWRKAKEFEVVVDLDQSTVKDMVLGGRLPLSGNIVADVLKAFDGIENGVFLEQENPNA